MKRIWFAMLAGIAVPLLAGEMNLSGQPDTPAILTGCSPQGKQEANSAVDIALPLAQLACIELSTLTSEQAVMEACKIADQPGLADFIHNLIGQREAAKKIGVAWPGSDAGAKKDAS